MIVKNYIMHSEKWDVCVFFYLEPNTTSCYRKDVIWKKISPLSFYRVNQNILYIRNEKKM